VDSNDLRLRLRRLLIEIKDLREIAASELEDLQGYLDFNFTLPHGAVNLIVSPGKMGVVFRIALDSWA